MNWTVPAILFVGLLLALPWTPWTGVMASPTPVGPYLDTPIYFLSAFGFAVLGMCLAQRDRWLGAAVIYTVILAFLRPNPIALPHTHGFAIGATAVVLTRSLPAYAVSWIRYALLGSALLQVPVMLAQTTNGDNFLPGTLGNPRYVGAVLAITLPLAPWWLVGWFALGLGISGSALAVFAALLGTIVRWSRRWTIVALCFVLIAGASVIATRTWPNIGVSLEDRVAVWHYGTQQLNASPIIGHGLGSWMLTVPWVQMRQRFSSDDQLWIRAHNDVLQWVYETGLIGAVLLIGWLWSHRRAWRDLVAVGVVAFGLFPFHWPTMAAYALLVIGLALHKEDTECLQRAKLSAA